MTSRRIVRAVAVTDGVPQGDRIITLGMEKVPRR